MKHSVRFHLVILMLGVVVNSCQKPERDNPWDELAQLNPEEWAPKQLEVQSQDLLNSTLNWSFEDKNIQGFHIDRKVGEQAWQEEYLKLPKTARSWNDSLIRPDTSVTYQYRVYAYAGNNTSSNTEASFTPLFEAPSNLQIEQLNDISFQLSWLNNTLWPENPALPQGFKIDRKTDEQEWQLAIATLPHNISNWVDTNVLVNRAETTVQYRVYAFYGELKTTALQSATTTSLTQPSELTIAQNSITSVTLSWQNNNQGAQGFILERSYDEQSWQQLQKNTLTSYTDADFELNQLVFYRVAAYYDDYLSEYDTSSFDAEIPVVESFDVVVENGTSAILSWQYPYSGHDGFFLERKINEDAWQSIASDIAPNQENYTDDQINLEQNNYAYRLSAFVGEEHSAYALISLSLPVVNTLEPYNIQASIATSGGEVTVNGFSEVSVRGVVWSINPMPDLENNDGFTEDGGGSGTFTSQITGLSPLTTYFVRAYAINEAGTTYGSQVDFVTTGITVIEVVNPSTGKTWMDRNLGASRDATSSTDDQAYGDLYQWGRLTDGHEKRSSGTTSSLSSSDTPGHGNFITASSSPYDWRSPQNNNLWQGENGSNNPCPFGYRLPTDAEWIAEYQSWSSENAAGAYASPLKLPLAGHRNENNGSLYDVGSYSYYWSATVDGSMARCLYFYSSTTYIYSDRRATGFSVRCIKD